MITVLLWGDLQAWRQGLINRQSLIMSPDMGVIRWTQVFARPDSWRVGEASGCNMS
jgi:hypothetical protein